MKLPMPQLSTWRRTTIPTTITTTRAPPPPPPPLCCGAGAAASAARTTRTTGTFPSVRASPRAPTPRGQRCRLPSPAHRRHRTATLTCRRGAPAPSRGTFGATPAILARTRQCPRWRRKDPSPRAVLPWLPREWAAVPALRHLLHLSNEKRVPSAPRRGVFLCCFFSLVPLPITYDLFKLAHSSVRAFSFLAVL
jgi:hypothetical protein